MKFKLEITEDVLKLIPFFFLQETKDGIEVKKNHMYMLGDHLLDDLALILGYDEYADKASRTDFNGKIFPKEIEEKMLKTHQYIVDNLTHIESLIHQYVVMGGIKEGIYECNAKDNIWFYKGKI